mgnify:FL=1
MSCITEDEFSRKTKSYITKIQNLKDYSQRVLNLSNFLKFMIKHKDIFNSGRFKNLKIIAKGRILHLHNQILNIKNKITNGIYDYYLLSFEEFKTIVN